MTEKTPPPSTASDAQAIIDWSDLRGDPHLVDIPPEHDKASLAILPTGRRIENLEPFLRPFRKAPLRRSGTANMDTLESFIDHANRFKDAHSAVFIAKSTTEPTAICVLDYHPGEGAPRFGDHRGVYTFPLSAEWKTWTANSGKTKSQAEFAEFIEDNIDDILPPTTISGTEGRVPSGVAFADPAHLMDLSRGMAIRVGKAVKNAVNLSNGTAQVQFVTEHTDDTGAPLVVPQGFLIGLAPFDRGAGRVLAARLRYRISGGSITWAYQLWRPEHCLGDAVQDAANTIAEKTKLPVLFGTPEQTA